MNEVGVPYNEEQILPEIAEGSVRAFRYLYDKYRPQAYAYFLKVTHSAEQAEDGVQDIFLKLWTMRNELPAIRQFEHYFRRMIHNYAISAFRKLATETQVLVALRHQDAALTDGVQDIAGRIQSKEVQRFVQAVIEKLTPQQRRVFLLSREGGLSHAEVANLLSITVNTVKKHSSDALQSIREALVNKYGIDAVAILIVFQLSHSVLDYF